MHTSRLLATATSAVMLTSCDWGGMPAEECGQLGRETRYTANVMLPDGGGGTTAIRPLVSVNEFKTSTKVFPTSWTWVANWGGVTQPDSVTASVDTVDASTPVGLLVKPGTSSQLAPAVATALIPALIAGRGHITVHTARGDSVRGALTLYGNAGAFSPRCID